MSRSMCGSPWDVMAMGSRAVASARQPGGPHHEQCAEAEHEGKCAHDDEHQLALLPGLVGLCERRTAAVPGGLGQLLDQGVAHEHGHAQLERRSGVAALEVFE